ncbi:MAG: LON peptidase substrate-binding domain-containing protein [Hyphomicrobiales bacterium]|nr:LON peptidase substrate-binding domain-containing protein [Hyphomicrobiales bacterium]
MASNIHYRSSDQLPKILRLFPLQGALLLPRAELPLNIFEPRYLQMFDDALGSDRMIGMIQTRAPGEDAPLFDVGCAGRITSFTESGDGRYLVRLTGVSRFRVGPEVLARNERPYRSFHVDYTPYNGDLAESAEPPPADREAVLDALRRYAERHNLQVDWESIREAPGEALVNALSMMSPFGADEKQTLLEAVDVAARAKALAGLAEFHLADGGGRKGHLH